MTGNRLWGGRFDAASSDLMRRFNDSFRFDRELLAHDLHASQAWVRALEACGTLTAAEASELIRALQSVAPPTADELDEYEDVHSYIEAKLREAIGPLAGKVHTGRSRNDQVATAFKLWIRDACDEVHGTLDALIRALATRADTEAATAMPGYTHSKRAEPVTFGHWCLAYSEMLLRDRARFTSARERGNVCPLGSGALSGSPLTLDRQALARDLGFTRATANSLDAVSDRDFAAEYLFAAALMLVHLSRLAEDLIFYSADEVGFVVLPDALATGSSRMPQKKNPDVLELVRGHAGRAIGELTGLLSIIKGLPLAYDKDLQLDKEPLFRVRATLFVALPLLTEMVRTLIVNREAMRAAASTDLLLATELADALAARGIPFREAHDIVSARVGEALKNGETLAELGVTEKISADDLQALDVDKALAKRKVTGGASPERVRAAAKLVLAQLETK